MHNGTPHASSRRSFNDDERSMRGDGRTNGGRSAPMDRGDRDDFGDNDFRRGADRSQSLSSSERQQFGQGYGPGSYGPAFGDDRGDDRHRDQGGFANNGGYTNSGFGQERYDGPRQSHGREQGREQGFGREQGYSSSNQGVGQQGFDRGYSDRGDRGSFDRGMSNEHRHGYGMSRDLDDRSSRAGYRLDGDLDRSDVSHRRDAVSFTERDRSDRQDHHGFDDRGIGAPQRSWSQSNGDQQRYGSREQHGSSRGVDTDNSMRWSQQSQSQSSSSTRYPSGPKGYQRSDERIKEDVCDRLAAMGDLDSSDVEVAVAGGEVTLTGTVPVRAMKYRCEQTCELINGVKDIVNQIRVSDRARGSDSSRSQHGGHSSQSSSASTGASDSATGSTMNANANNKAPGTTTSTARTEGNNESKTEGKADGKNEEGSNGSRRP